MEQDKRKRLIKLIHVAKRELQMDDDTYRSILMEIGNTNSSSKMSISKLSAVLDHFKQAGFKVVPKAKVNLPLASDPQSKKIRALWLELHKIGVVQDSSEHALSRFVKRTTGVDSLKWLNTDQAGKVIENLKKWLARFV